jgi:hypothetical protein
VASAPTAAAVYRRRRWTAGAVLLALIAAGIAFASSRGGSGAPSAAAPARATPSPAPTAAATTLPRGGRRILPDFRVVAYYGAPQDRQLGALGIGTPDEAVKRLLRQAHPYARPGRPVLPALELIAVVAARSPGEDGSYALRLPDAVIRRYLHAARRAKALLVLDIQPGRSDFLTEAVRLQKWLEQPDVGLALDPEWRMGRNDVPGKVIGHVGAREVNATTAWLARLVAARKLPEKLLLVHQFTDGMVPVAKLAQPPGLAYVLNVDGFGTQELKIAKYNGFVSLAPQFRRGFKLFYQEDTATMTPAQVMRLRPQPDVIVYE